MFRRITSIDSAKCVLSLKKGDNYTPRKKCHQLFHDLITTYTRLDHPINYVYIPFDNKVMPLYTGLTLISPKPKFQWNAVSYHRHMKDDILTIKRKVNQGVLNVFDCGLCSMDDTKFTKITGSIEDENEYNYYSHIIEYMHLYVTTHEVDPFVEPHFFIVTKNHVENFGYFYTPYILSEVFDVLKMLGDSFYAIGQGYMGRVPKHCHFHVSNESLPVFKYIPHVQMRQTNTIQYGIYENKIVLMCQSIDLLYEFINRLYQNIGHYLLDLSLDCSIACGYYNGKMCIILGFIMSKDKTLLKKNYRFSVAYGKFFYDGFKFTETYMSNDQIFAISQPELLYHFDAIRVELCKLEPYLSEMVRNVFTGKTLFNKQLVNIVNIPRLLSKSDKYMKNYIHQNINRSGSLIDQYFSEIAYMLSVVTY